LKCRDGFALRWEYAILTSIAGRIISRLECHDHKPRHITRHTWLRPKSRFDILHSTLHDPPTLHSSPPFSSIPRTSYNTSTPSTISQLTLRSLHPRDRSGIIALYNLVIKWVVTIVTALYLFASLAFDRLRMSPYIGSDCILPVCFICF